MQSETAPEVIEKLRTSFGSCAKGHAPSLRTYRGVVFVCCALCSAWWPLETSEGADDPDASEFERWLACAEAIGPYFPVMIGATANLSNLAEIQEQFAGWILEALQDGRVKAAVIDSIVEMEYEKHG